MPGVDYDLISEVQAFISRGKTTARIKFYKSTRISDPAMRYMYTAYTYICRRESRYKTAMQDAVLAVLTAVTIANIYAC